jgi:hypothetical protein
MKTLLAWIGGPLTPLNDRARVIGTMVHPAVQDAFRRLAGSVCVRGRGAHAGSHTALDAQQLSVRYPTRPFIASTLALYQMKRPSCREETSAAAASSLRWNESDGAATFSLDAISPAVRPSGVCSTRRRKTSSRVSWESAARARRMKAFRIFTAFALVQ